MIQNVQPAWTTTNDEQDTLLLTPNDIASLWEQDAVARYEARLNNTPLGPVTGIPALDSAMSGCLAPGIHVLTGNAGTGKTAFALQVAVDCGFPALFASCEMQPLELLRRVTARATGIYLGRFKSGEFSPEESVNLMKKGVESAPGLVFADGTRSFLEPEWLTSASRITKGDAPHVLLVVDSLQSWADSSQMGSTEYERLNLGIAALGRISAKLGCPVLCISERNRAGAAGGLGSGAGTRKIEYGAETQLDLERDSKDSRDFDGNVPIRLIVSKNRNGAAGVDVNLVFHGAKQAFDIT